MSKTFEDYGIVIPNGTSGGEIRTTCPQCSPGRHKAYDRCLAVNLEKSVWYCHHCGWAGGLGGTQAETEQARRTFKRPHFVEAAITDKRVLDWFTSRGIGRATLAAFHVTAGPERFPVLDKDAKGQWETVTSIQFPFYLGGMVVNVKCRTVDKRFRQASDAQKCFFNYDMALAAAKAKGSGARLIVTEGEMDCLALFEAGFHCCVSVPDGAPTPNSKTFASKFSFLDGMEPLLDAVDAIVLAVDNDAPGLKLRTELCRRLGMERCLKVLWPEGCKDANDVLVKHGKEALNRCINEATPFPIDGVRSGRDLWDLLFELHDSPEKTGVDIGWANATGVFNVEPGQMSIVTGIPSHGKSTFIDALRINLLRLYGWASAAFSPENWPVENHFALLTEMYAGKNFRELSQDELYGYAEQIIDSLFFIQPENDKDMMTVDAILERARALIYRYGIKILVIDPWNEIDHTFEAGQREDQYISAQLSKIRRFARVNGVHIFVIAHPRQLEKNKDGVYLPPTAYEIAGGAMWRNKADNILCVYRPDMKTSETSVYVQKIRFHRNGKAGACMRFKFHVGTSTYHPVMDKGC